MAAFVPRVLLALSSSVLALGGAAHALAFPRASAVIGGSNLAPFVANSSRALWLGDSVTSFVLAAVFGLIAARPAAASGLVVALLALIPAAVAVLIYRFLGGFYAGHMLLTASAAAFVAGLRWGAPYSTAPGSTKAAPPSA